ncbi:hypothetical protein [Streptomyces inusitatus]|nr:hypothetical protein [Streptomyces inusitatus]
MRSAASPSAPATRLILALAAVHAARVGQITTLILDEVGLGNRRLSIAGRARPLDDLTLQLLLDWLDHRRSRWPATENLHLLINNQAANTTSRASNRWISAPMRGQGASLERLLFGWQLEEVMAKGPDPLYLAEVFGFGEKTAMHCADSARALLGAGRRTNARASAVAFCHSACHVCTKSKTAPAPCLATNDHRHQRVPGPLHEPSHGPGIPHRT